MGAGEVKVLKEQDGLKEKTNLSSQELGESRQFICTDLLSISQARAAEEAGRTFPFFRGGRWRGGSNLGEKLWSDKRFSALLMRVK